MNHNNILFVGTSFDKSYLPYLKGCVGSAKVFLYPHQFKSGVSTLAELFLYAKPREITAIVTTSPDLLDKLLPLRESKTLPKIDNYAGSMFTKTFQDKTLEILIVNPLEHLITVPYGKFLTSRYITKLTTQAKWLNPPEFNWCVLSLRNVEEEFAKMSKTSLCAVDIETFKENLAIRCIGFTHLTLKDGVYVSRSVVLPMDNEWCMYWAAKFLDHPSAKILQNGKYDINYLMRYGLILNNYVWDTATLMHAWYAELPKDLASLSSFFVRDSMYWKDLAETNDLEQYYLYNAKDTHQTALVLLSWIREAPAWARKNYELEFPLLFPCILSELTGVKRDLTKLNEVSNEYKAKIEAANLNLSNELGVRNFNTNSPPQKKALLKILGCGDLDATDEPSLAKARLRHPLNNRLLSQVSKIQKMRKLESTYLCEGKELNGRILYALNPHGTDTGRLASREHHFWCGLQIQNIPRGKEVKQTLVADEGFYLAESDLEQAESRDTAYITGDTNLIKAVESGHDFHATNASAFFGVPYSKIYNDDTKETLDKALRDLAKRVNHGASYNMGWFVLIGTMGEDKIAEAQKLLNLPPRWTLREVAEHLLSVFAKTYPVVRNDYQTWVKHQVELKSMLVGATDWTRYCFSNPSKSKSALNGYIAHNPQSLNAMVLNKAYKKVFYEIAMENPRDYKLLAQIHDSIFFQYRKGREDLAYKTKELMEIPVVITDISGIQRTFTVPAALKMGGTRWSDL